MDTSLLKSTLRPTVVETEDDYVDTSPSPKKDTEKNLKAEPELKVPAESNQINLAKAASITDQQRQSKRKF